jgi:hypothetical protein
MFGNRKDYAKRFFTFFTVEFICGHVTPPFLGGIPHNDRIDTIFMLVSNYLITGELSTVTLRYIETIARKWII